MRTPTVRTLVSDERFPRAVLTLLFVVVVGVQLGVSRAPSAPLGWILFVPTALLAVWSLLPGPWTPTRWRTVLCAAYAVIAGLLFALPAHTLSAGFVYLAALTAGLSLGSRRAAGWIAVTASLVAAGSAFVLDQVQPLPWPWWLGFSAGLPVYYGVARRARAMTADALRRALVEAERARSSESREAALLERSRIAREIHDVLGHSLAAISIQLDLADALYGVDRPSESISAVRRARDLARSGIADTKRAVQALEEDAPSVDESVRLVAYSFGAPFTTRGELPALDVRIAQALIRATREALSNAHRHAPEGRRSVELRFDGPRDSTGATVELIVTNDLPAGRSLRQTEETGTHMGLQGMRERAELLGGTVTAGPAEVGAPEQGDTGRWVLTMRLPL